MPRAPIFLFGAGGHARVVFDVVEREGRFNVVVVLDDAPTPGQRLSGVPVHRRPDDLAELRVRGVPAGIIAIGDNRARQRVAAAVAAAGLEFVTATDPSACIGREVTLGAGSVIMPGVIVNVGTRIGDHVILNTGASVDHDCTIDAFAHISPGVHIGGHCRIGSGSHVGIGASVIPSVRIGCHATIGAGAAVIRDVPDGVVAVGVPARPVRRRDP